MKNCLTPHPVMHTLTGFGLGLVTAGLVSTFAGSNGVSFGLVLIAAGLLGEFLINNTKSKK